MQPTSLDVRCAPWTRYLTIKQVPLSSEELRFRIMLAARNLTIDSTLLDRVSEEEEPVEFSRNASIVFARLPSGYFALLVRSVAEAPGAEDGYINVIFTSAVPFSFDEKPLKLSWVNGAVRFTLRPATHDVFWAIVRCIGLSRSDRECDPVLRYAQDEVCILQRRLECLERVAFLTTLEQSTTVE